MAIPKMVKCEHCGFVTQNNFLRCPVCGKSKTIDIKKK